MYVVLGVSVSMVYIKYFVFGNVAKSFVEHVLSLVRGFLETVDSLDYLEVYFYGSSRDKMAFLEGEALELGVVAIGDFIAMHEAWRGWPRVHIDYEMCLPLPRRYLEAVVIHEISHAVLHGSPVFYILSVDPDIIASLGSEEAFKFVYIASTIIKDLEVHRFLVEKGFRDAVQNYAEFLAEQIADIDCEDLYDILQYVKVVTPCLFLDRCPLREPAGGGCGGIVEGILGVLKMFVETGPWDLSKGVSYLLRFVLKIFSGSSRGKAPA